QRVVERLIGEARRIRDQGGTPYFSTSRRTPPAVVEALKAGLPDGSRFFEWSPGASDNPYRALLGSADGFLVTGDSISMMVEIVRLRKPLAILDLPTSFLGTLDQSRRRFGRWLFAPVGDSAADRLRSLLGRLVYHSRIIAHTRDFRAFHRLLIDCGLAVAAGQELVPPSGEIPDDLPQIVDRIRQLVGSR
ncbi:MAG TPA: nucleoside-diphosphate sugar epimerase, partial [Gammaproteobacteria bacterium]|nr:nucleoside-diphosphate sugar epimerase [Gammaproteobacteria bacterium]